MMIKPVRTLPYSRAQIKADRFHLISSLSNLLKKRPKVNVPRGLHRTGHQSILNQFWCQPSLARSASITRQRATLRL